MHPKRIPVLCAVGVLVCSSLACSLLGGGEKEMITEPMELQLSIDDTVQQQSQPLSDESQTGQDASADYETNFPLPVNVQNFTRVGEDQINFQTSMSLQECVAFYRTALVANGLTERDSLMEVNETTFSLVFDGDSQGAIIVQGVDLGNGTSNINIRYEDV